VEKQLKCLFVLIFIFYQQFWSKKILENCGQISKNIEQEFCLPEDENQQAFLKNDRPKWLNSLAFSSSHLLKPLLQSNFTVTIN